MIHAVVPVKQLERAKMRLAPALNAHERRDLALAMLRDVLHTLATARGLEAIWVVTADPLVGELADEYGAGWLPDRAGTLNGALHDSARWLMREGVAGMLIVPADVPLLTVSDIDHLVQPNAEAGLTITPSHDGDGTNAMALWPPTAVEPGFGPHSFVHHLRSALANGLSVRVYRAPGLALDIDTPADLQALMQYDCPPATAAILRASGQHIPFEPLYAAEVFH